MAADALSRIVVTSDELKGMNKHIASVMTRRMRRMQGDECKDTDLVDNSSTDCRIDHPNVVELLKKPNSGLEFRNGKYKASCHDDICIQDKQFLYLPSKYTIYSDVDTRSCSARAAFVRGLESFCKKINVDELYIVKNKKKTIY